MIEIEAAKDVGATPAVADPDADPGVSRPALAVALAAVAAALGWAYAPNLASLVRIWSDHPDYSHGFLVGPVALLVLWRRRADLDVGSLSPTAWGWVLVAASLALRAYGFEAGREWTEDATLLPVLAGLVLALGGWRAFRWAAPALAYLVFALPLPTRVNALLCLPLQRLAALGSRSILRLSGLWVMTEGNVLVFGSHRLEVAVACNGLSMLMTLAATVSAMILLVPMAAWKRWVLLASIIPVAVLSNVLRIVATAWCYDRFGAEVGRAYAHDAAGWLMMPTALVLVGLELAWLSWLIDAPEEPAEVGLP